MKHFLIKYLTAFSLLTFSGILQSCNNREKTVKENSSKEVKADTLKKEEGVAEVTAEQMKAVGIEVGEIQNMNLANVVRASGQLTVPPQNRAVVNALVGGVIRKINVIEGQQVAKGQVMVLIENPDFIRLQQDYLTSRDNIVYLRQEFERQKTLKDADAGIGKVYQQASANYAAESSKLSTIQKQLLQIHINSGSISRGNLITQIPILAPISGTVGHIKLSIGAYTDASSPIMEIINNYLIICDLQVYEKDISKITVGQTIKFTLTNMDNKQVTGHVTGINKSFETENKSVIVHSALNNDAPLNLIAGQYVSALIETGQQAASAVPKEAIVRANDKSYVFVFAGIEKEAVKATTSDRDDADKDRSKSQFVEKQHFKMVEVVTGAEEMGFTEIKFVEKQDSPVKIVIKGAFYLYSSMQTIETDDL